MALDHPGALAREHAIALMHVLYAQYGARESGEALAISFGVFRAEVMAGWPVVNFGGVSARMLTRSYALPPRWNVHWLHPVPLDLPFDHSDKLLQTLIDAGVPIATPSANGTELDASKIRHIPFPDCVGAIRRSHSARRDLSIDVAVCESGATSVATLRVVRALR